MWAAIADDAGGVRLRAFQAGRLTVRRNLHVGVGFLRSQRAASAGRVALRFRRVVTLHVLCPRWRAPARLVLAIHGLGGTKGSFLPTVAALADRFRVIAVDLPGFGDSDKPIGAAYDPRFFADAMIDLLDALELDRADPHRQQLGGRVALELALRHPERSVASHCSHPRWPGDGPAAGHRLCGWCDRSWAWSNSPPAPSCMNRAPPHPGRR